MRAPKNPSTQRQQESRKMQKGPRPAASDLSSLLGFDDITGWRQVDPLIRRGYRDELPSVRKCVASLLRVHNESVNAWSHLLPAVMHIVVLVAEGEVTSYEGKRIVHFYILTAVVCLLASTAYHVMNAHSQRVARSVLKLDYVGIVVNTAGGCISSTCLGFRDRMFLRGLWVTVTLGLAVVVLGILLRPEADGKASAVWRTILFGALLSTLYLPMLWGYVSGGSEGLQCFPLRAAIITNTFYVVGVLFYISRFPERFFPETFDIWGSSHQIFHICVMVGQILYVRGLKSKAAQICG